MALTLSSTLLAAQTSATETSRQPIAKINSLQSGDAYPLVGTLISNPVISHIDGAFEYPQVASSTTFLDDGSLIMVYGSAYYYESGYGSDDKADSVYMQVTGPDAAEFDTRVRLDNSAGAVEDTCTVVVDQVLQTIGVAVQYATYPEGTNQSKIALLLVEKDGTVLSDVKLDYLDYLQGMSLINTGTEFVLVYIRRVTDSYLIYKVTSTDFITWGTPSVIEIPSLPISTPIKQPCLTVLNDGYMLSFSAVTVVTDDTDVYNIVYSLSTDLATWSATLPITTSTALNVDYANPVIVEKEDNSLYIAVEEQNSYLTMDETATGWTTDYPLGAWNLELDSAAGKLYFSNFYSTLGNKHFRGIGRIDIETWSLDKCYHTGSTPPLPQVFNADWHCFELPRHGIDNTQVSVHQYEAISVVDFTADTVRSFYFRDFSSLYGVETEINIVYRDTDEGEDFTNIHATDIIDNKVWIATIRTQGLRHKVALGYIDLTQSSEPYEVVQVHNGEAEAYCFNSVSMVRFYPDVDLALVGIGYGGGNSYETCLMLQPLDGSNSNYRYYSKDVLNTFPHGGVIDAVLIGNTIWGLARYDGEYADEIEKWGLMELDIITNNITWHYPPWLTAPGSYYTYIELNSSETELILRSTSGVAVFNYTTHLWERYDLATNPDYPPEDPIGLYDGGDTPAVEYDPTTRFFFYGGEHAINMVPRDGVIHTIQYTTGVDADGYLFSPFTQLTVKLTDTEPALSLSPDDGVYISWTDNDEGTIAVAQDATAFELTDYLTGEINITSSVEATGTLNFTLADGQLFDPLNKNSLYRGYVAKGRRIDVYLGDNTESGIEYAQQGSFVIRNTTNSHRRGANPTVSVGCEDYRCLWSMHQIVATAFSEALPEDAIESIITNNTRLSAGDLVIPTFPLSFEFECQWIDAYVSDMVDDVAHRFQHFSALGSDGKIEFRPFELNGEVDNFYGINDVTSYKTDDSFSDFTNQIIVSGVSLLDFQVTFAEERIDGINGTIGWYGFEKDFTIHYSDDDSKRAIDPRLVVLESATSILFKLRGDISERISDIDLDDRWCIIEVKAPSLTYLLVTAIGIYAVGNYMGDLVVAPEGSGITIPMGRRIEGIGLLLALAVLGSMGNFQYEIWARPIGYVKRNYSATYDDLEFQQELGYIVTETLEGFLCSTPEHCQTVADFEGLVAKAQRSRATVEKVAHLQDEVGDTVSVPHPYTGETTKMFITDITRKYKPGSTKMEGYFTDEISGWVG